MFAVSIFALHSCKLRVREAAFSTLNSLSLSDTENWATQREQRENRREYITHRKRREIRKVIKMYSYSDISLTNGNYITQHGKVLTVHRWNASLVTFSVNYWLNISTYGYLLNCRSLRQWHESTRPQLNWSKLVRVCSALLFSLPQSSRCLAK